MATIFSTIQSTYSNTSITRPKHVIQSTDSNNKKSADKKYHIGILKKAARLLPFTLQMTSFRINVIVLCYQKKLQGFDILGTTTYFKQVPKSCRLAATFTFYCLVPTNTTSILQTYNRQICFQPTK